MIVNDVTLVCIDCLHIDAAVASMKATLNRIQFKHAVLMTSCPCDYEHTIKIDPIKSLSDYSAFVINDLHARIETCHALIVQHDGWVIDGSKWDESWKEFDYIGGNTFWTEPGSDGKGGNGGFSLRSKRLLEAMSHGYVDVKYEDMFYSSMPHRRYFESIGMKFATRRIQQSFALDNQDYSGQFGHHRGMGLYL